mmetsp:Transcript_52631/g.87419  ORF Transcript_52631/g.87419 Transcript_52631/m.87419 type:complete len:228 (-) Transcript_52631:429-1112(-)
MPSLPFLLNVVARVDAASDRLMSRPLSGVGVSLSGRAACPSSRKRITSKRITSRSHFEKLAEHENPVHCCIIDSTPRPTSSTKPTPRESKRKKNRLSRAESDSETCAETRATWVQCDACHKWRRMPSGTGKGADMPELDGAWFCAMNPDRCHAFCDAPEEHENEDEMMEYIAVREKVLDERGQWKRQCATPGCHLPDFHRGLCNSLQPCSPKRHKTGLGWRFKYEEA